MATLVVSDTSCVSNLIAIGKAELLAALFSEVVIPSAVERELRVEHVDIPRFLRVEALRAPLRNFQFPAPPRLDVGEAEAIALALEIGADHLLMDERRGREVAAARGLRVIGLLGVLLRAKQGGHVPTLMPLVAALVENGF